MKFFLENSNEKTEMNEVEEKFDELCLICNEFMGQFQNQLSKEAAFSKKPIFQLFGESGGMFRGFLEGVEVNWFKVEEFLGSFGRIFLCKM